MRYRGLARIVSSGSVAAVCAVALDSAGRIPGDGVAAAGGAGGAAQPASKATVAERRRAGRARTGGMAGLER
jgi:hypothetical protein